jgi:general secretion pathway protein G
MKHRSGFTLVEIMLVVAILGVLASVAVPRFAGRTQEARMSAARLQIENLSAALDAFEFDCGRYPTTSEGLDSLLKAPAGIESWKGPYLKKRVPLDPWNRAYLYQSPGETQLDYDIISFGIDGKEGGGDDISNS